MDNMDIVHTESNFFSAIKVATATIPRSQDNFSIKAKLIGLVHVFVGSKLKETDFVPNFEKSLLDNVKPNGLIPNKDS
jgi:hypothetical protein